MSNLRNGILVVALGAGLAGLLAGDAATVGITNPDAMVPASAWAETKWPFLLDQWGLGKAFRCAPGDCGTEVKLYIRPKIGFCNCATGVADDAELDRVGDLEIFSDKFVGLSDGREILVAHMKGRSRPYRVDMRYEAPLTALSIGFNDKCDVVVATIIADRERLAAAERVGLEFLNSDRVVRWVEKELGL
ncbi:MAG: hypothetical protein QOI88_4399 [Gammaproteobacteria bacterium]|nr:hypothetical protein [Gammaproteobacteria bacterium]